MFMRKNSPFILDERGFYLPVVLVVAVIILTSVITSILIYKNELETTELLLEQLDIETSLQIAIGKFEDEQLYKTLETGEFNYMLPNSHVNGYFSKEDEGTFVQFYITTKHLEYKYNHFIHDQ